MRPMFAVSPAFPTLPPTNFNLYLQIPTTPLLPSPTTPHLNESCPQLTQPQPHNPPTTLTFTSLSSLHSPSGIKTYNLRSRIEPVKNCRKISKRDMKHNDAMPRMRVDPESYRVEADGVHLTAQPAETLPLGQGYFVF